MEWKVRTMTLGLNRVSLQLLLSTEITNDNCKNWANDLLSKSEVTNTISTLLTTWLNDSTTSGLLAFLTLRSQNLASGIISFTSSSEYFLKDIIIECLRRNLHLRKKGFNFKKDNFDANSLFSLKNLEDYNSIEKAKIQVMKQLASIFSKGETFSDKFGRVCSFLDLNDEVIPKLLINSLNSIWRLRNKIAHIDLDKVDWVFETLNGNKIEYNQYNEEQYLPFVLELIKVIIEIENVFKSFGSKAETKWPIKDEISHVYFP